MDTERDAETIPPPIHPRRTGHLRLDPIELTTTDIGDAAIREIVQMSLTSVPFEVFLEQLLVPNDPWFRWIGQLGEIRETRTALSGLFGRFVARTYLRRHHGFHYFEPIRAELKPLAAWPTHTVRKNDDGDLPDWIVATAAGANTFAVAEAKGSHNVQGPKLPLAAAKKQAARIDILGNGHPLVVKRYAVATRWSVSGHAGLQEPYLWVDDPEDGAIEPSPEDRANVARGIRLGHYATTAEGLGLPATAAAIRRAKDEESGGLDLPRAEQIEITGDGTERKRALAAVVVPNGVVPLPRDVDLNGFRDALLTLFGRRTLVFVVRTDAILAADRNEERGIVETPSSADPDFWGRPRIQADGTELIPLLDVKLTRTPAD